jgi:DNA (cytosine-5)-methyltransferase 1
MKLVMGVVGLYAGIGGFELGFQAAGYDPILLADSDEYCRALLETRFPNARVEGDVRDIRSLPKNTEVVTAGFPCQNLSMAGDKSGMNGGKTGDVTHMFQLLRRGARPTLAIENVNFMLHVQRGTAMAELVRELEGLGYEWAYRVVNSMAFGLPQRRRRVFLVASQTVDPRDVLFADEASPIERPKPSLHRPIGFYWTEGRSGWGAAVDSVPPLKVASTVGIPSMPAVLFPDGEVLTPSIEACEKLQGFEAGWTELAYDVRRSPRWRMVGNAVSVPAAKWLASRIRQPGRFLPLESKEVESGSSWPRAAFGGNGKIFAVDVSDRPIHERVPSISEMRDASWKPLSYRALNGFISRAEAGSLRFPTGFLETLKKAKKLAASSR